MRLVPALVLATLGCDCGTVALVAARNEVRLNPAEVDFGEVELGRRLERDVLVQLDGLGPVTVGPVVTRDPGPFASSLSPVVLSGNGSHLLRVAFEPVAIGAFEATLGVATDLEESPRLTLHVKGSARCVDQDDDGFGAGCAPGPDCDDTRDAVHPGAAETCANGLDDDCDPATGDACAPCASDADGDGFGEGCTLGPDCNDLDPAIHPGAPERCGNAYDDDCDPATPDACPPSCPPGGCTSGCADGVREAFVDLARYPFIAGCGGGFALPGVFRVEPPACARAAGDDGPNPDGTGCNASDLCAAGWHVCRHPAEIAAKSPDGCAGAREAADQFFATRQSGSGCGACSVSVDASELCTGLDCRSDCYPTDEQTNDVFGCGGAGSTSVAASCAPIDRFGHNACSALPAPWTCADTNGNDEALRVRKPGPSGGGVLCCLD